MKSETKGLHTWRDFVIDVVVALVEPVDPGDVPGVDDGTLDTLTSLNIRDLNNIMLRSRAFKVKLIYIIIRNISQS